MISYLKKVTLRKSLNNPDVALLNAFIDCFAAGYRRGLKDAHSELRSDAWAELVANISMRLSRERSHAEAGCWLAGVVSGCSAATQGVRSYVEADVREVFFEVWDSGHVQAYAEQTITSVLQRHSGPISVLLELDEASA